MLDKKEKIVMEYIFNNCEKGKSRLFPAQEFIDFILMKKYILSLSELDEIMITLSKENMIDYVQSESKKGTIYCVSLKNKGFIFKKDLQKEKRYTSWIIVRTALLALLSFIIGILLKAIFG
ncbi:MAG: hypothetical protein PHS54_04480 [Clostridia bacterium]|nr:hypothetical protein [Clostridia bacterium]